MSIKFICSCGKHLRARDEMAARRSRCPRCGQPVGIPSMRPTHAGTAVAPLTPLERLRLSRLKPSTEAVSGVASAAQENRLGALTQPRSPLESPAGRKPKIRRRRQLEQRWYQCLVYPLLNLKVFLCFALVLSVGMAMLLVNVQRLSPFTALTETDWLAWFFLAYVVGLIAAYAFATVECALASALAGEGPAPCWPVLRVAFPLKSALRLVLCFFAGPVVPACIAVYFWFYGGDLKTLDWLILAELGVFTVAYWFLAIVSANERNRLSDANPLRVALLVHRLNYRACVPVLIAPALLIPHVPLGLFALTILHEQPFGGWLLLMGCCASSLFWAAFLFRLLGVWCYTTIAAEPKA